MVRIYLLMTDYLINGPKQISANTKNYWAAKTWILKEQRKHPVSYTCHFLFNFDSFMFQ